MPSLRTRPRTVGEAMITDVKLCDVRATVGDVRRLFGDDHVQAAVVVEDGILRTVIDRDDLVDGDDRSPALPLGQLGTRVTTVEADLTAAHRVLLESRRRRLAVVGQDGTFRGLLCLKRSMQGFCSEQDTRDRRC